MKNQHSSLNARGPNHCLAQIIFEELARLGCKHVVLSPGARSAPLALAAYEHPQLELYVAYDERSAAFLAAGIGKATGTPALLLCTSGTAVAHYLPAVIECSLTDTPLFVISADRPPELHHTGSNQTIPQDLLFGEFVVAQRTLFPPDTLTYYTTALAETNWLYHKSFHGPVHLNVQIRKPLIEPDFQPVPVPNQIEQWYTSGRASSLNLYHSSPPATWPPDLVQIAANSTTGIIIAGPIHHLSEQQAVRQLVQTLHWPCMTEVASGLSNQLPNCFFNPTAEQLASLQCDLILHLGGLPTNTASLNFLTTTRSPVIQINPSTRRIDTHAFVRYRIQATIAASSAALIKILQPATVTQPTKSTAQATALHDALLTGHLTELTAIHTILQNLNPTSALYLANSLTIRHASLAGGCAHAHPIGIHRGASGIDGTIGLALGFAYGLQQTTILITGDLAFLHDLNSLYLLRQLQATLIIIVINNDGGGIFNQLPTLPELSGFETLFTAPHGLNLKHASDLFGLKHYLPQTLVDLTHTVKATQTSKESCVVEVRAHCRN